MLWDKQIYYILRYILININRISIHISERIWNELPSFFVRGYWNALKELIASNRRQAIKLVQFSKWWIFSTEFFPKRFFCLNSIQGFLADCLTIPCIAIKIPFETFVWVTLRRQSIVSWSSRAIAGTRIKITSFLLMPNCWRTV